MNWLVLVILSAIFSSFSRILQKILLKEKDSKPFTFAFIFQLLLALLFLIYTLITNTLTIPNLLPLIPNLLLMAIFYSLGNVFVSSSFKFTEASEASIILASSTLWTVVSAVLILGDKLTKTNVFGIILVVLGLLAVNYTKSKWKINKGHLYALLAALMFGIAFTNDAFIINHFASVSSYMLVCFILSSLAILIMKPRLVSDVPFFLKKGMLGKLLICGIFYVGMIVTIFEAYKKGGQVSIISPVQQSALIVTVTISYFLLKEKDRLINKIIGTALTFIGVLLLI